MVYMREVGGLRDGENGKGYTMPGAFQSRKKMRRWMSVVKTLGSKTEVTRGQMRENRMHDWGQKSEERDTEKESTFV